MAVPGVVRRYAPLIVLHRDERLLPMSAESFVRRSTLRWSTGRSLRGTLIPEARTGIDARRLGAASPQPYLSKATRPTS